MLAWFARLSPLRMTLLAAAWPTLLLIGLLGGYLWLITGDHSYFVGFTVVSWPALLLIVFAPTVIVVALWRLGWKRGDSAT